MTKLEPYLCRLNNAAIKLDQTRVNSIVEYFAKTMPDLLHTVVKDTPYEVSVAMAIRYYAQLMSFSLSSMGVDDYTECTIVISRRDSKREILLDGDKYLTMTWIQDIDFEDDLNRAVIMTQTLMMFDFEYGDALKCFLKNVLIQPGDDANVFGVIITELEVALGALSVNMTVTENMMYIHVTFPNKTN